MSVGKGGGNKEHSTVYTSVQDESQSVHNIVCAVCGVYVCAVGGVCVWCVCVQWVVCACGVCVCSGWCVRVVCVCSVWCVQCVVCVCSGGVCVCVGSVVCGQCVCVGGWECMLWAAVRECVIAANVLQVRANVSFMCIMHHR